MGRRDLQANPSKRAQCARKGVWDWAPTPDARVEAVKGAVKSALFGADPGHDDDERSARDHMEASGEFEVAPARGRGAG